MPRWKLTVMEQLFHKLVTLDNGQALLQVLGVITIIIQQKVNFITGMQYQEFTITTPILRTKNLLPKVGMLQVTVNGQI